MSMDMELIALSGLLRVRGRLVVEIKIVGF
jgi:hypothetical protein